MLFSTCHQSSWYVCGLQDLYTHQLDWCVYSRTEVTDVGVEDIALVPNTRELAAL